MSYSNGLLSDNIGYQNKTQGKQGPQGLPGVGFKLTSSGDFDIQNKKLENVDTDENNAFCAVNMTTLKNSIHEKEKDIDLQDKYNVKNSKQQSFGDLSMNYDNLVSYNDVENIFLSRKKMFPMETALDMGNNTIFNVKDPTVSDQGVNKRYVDVETAKNRVEINRVEFDLNTDMSAAQNLIKTKADKTYVDAENVKQLSLSGGTMTGQIDMGGNKVVNVATPTNNSDATNKLWVDNQVGTIVSKQSQLEEKLKKYTIDSHSLKDEFRYLMEDVDESSSESGIQVAGIVDYANSPHKFNKKAYLLELVKRLDNTYISRLGFNMYKLPQGEFTICVEFIPVGFLPISVSATSSSVNVGLQKTVGHRTIIHIHKYRISPPEYLMIDLHCRGSPTSPRLGQAYLIIYGVSGYHSDVSPTVYNAPYILGSSSMIMQANLNMNNHTIINSPSIRNVFVINGFYNRSVNSTQVLFSGGNQVIVPVNCKIVKCKIKITETLSSYHAVTLKINNKIVTGGTNQRSQTYNVDLKLFEDDTIKVVIIQSGSSLQSTINLFTTCVVSLLLETT